jgi:hypothetical protein
MRHDPAVGALVIMLRGLKMHGMAQAVDELAQQGAPAFQSAIPMLSQLLKAETAEREVRSMAYQIKIARFPAYRDLAGFDFASSEVNVRWSPPFGRFGGHVKLGSGSLTPPVSFRHHLSRRPPQASGRTIPNAAAWHCSS